MVHVPSPHLLIFRIYRKRLVLLILVTTMRNMMTIIGADETDDTDLFLEELVAHGEERDGKPRAEEKNEVGGQLVPVFSSCIWVSFNFKCTCC